MPLFTVHDDTLRSVEQTNFAKEKQLQRLVEDNLRPIFNCCFVASEFSTGANHAGRIDTLALSEDDNPVIIEYKKVESSELINQSLYYLHWIYDHKGDFEIACQAALGADVEIDWSDVRVICIAPNYKKYDLHAALVMDANLELWTYRLFKNGSIYLEEILQKSYGVAAASPSSASPAATGKNPVMVEAGKKAAMTRKTATYTLEEHFDGKPREIRELAELVREFVLSLDPGIEENPKKRYIAYRISQNIVCMKVQANSVVLFVKLDPKRYQPLPDFASDVSNAKRPGDLRIHVRDEADFLAAREYIERAYQNIGG